MLEESDVSGAINPFSDIIDKNVYGKGRVTSAVNLRFPMSSKVRRCASSCRMVHSHTTRMKDQEYKKVLGVYGGDGIPDVARLNAMSVIESGQLTKDRAKLEALISVCQISTDSAALRVCYPDDYKVESINVSSVSSAACFSVSTKNLERV